jgi:hypothetical protein
MRAALLLLTQGVSAMAPVPIAAGVCSTGCAAEFFGCVMLSTLEYNGCRAEIDQPHPGSKLGAVCEQSCEDTPSMAKLMPTAGVTYCTASCADEFVKCARFGPGFQECRGQIEAASSDKLAQAGCVPKCVETPKMTAENPTTCSATCSVEFAMCVHHGPGFDKCMDELQSPNPGPLKTKGGCGIACTPTASMLGLKEEASPPPPPSPPPPSPSTTVTDVNSCLHGGFVPGGLQGTHWNCEGTPTKAEDCFALCGPGYFQYFFVAAPGEPFVCKEGYVTFNSLQEAENWELTTTSQMSGSNGGWGDPGNLMYYSTCLVKDHLQMSDSYGD